MKSVHVRLVLLVLLLLAFALRVTNLGAQELRGDEAFGYFFVQNSYRDIIHQTFALQEPHPVASYFLLKAWLGVAGQSEYALRFAGVWFGVLAVALLARLAHRLQMTSPALRAACVLLAISPYAIWHSQDARMYAMSLALTIALVWWAVEALTRRRWPWVVAYIAVALLALHTHYFVAYVLIALTLFVLGRALVIPSARRAAVDWVLWNALAFLLYLPWLAGATAIVSGYGGNGDSPALADALLRAASVFAAGETTPPAQRAWWAALAGLVVALGALRLARRGANDRRTLWLLFCWLAIPLLLTWYSAQSRPIFNERYLVAAAPAFYLLAGASLEPLPRRRWLDIGAVAMLLCLVVGMVLGTSRYHADPAYAKSRGWREVAERAEQLAGGLDTNQVRFVQNYPDPTLWYYLAVNPHLTLPPAALDRSRAAAEVAALVDADIKRVVLIQQNAPTWDDYAQGSPGEGIAAETLQRHYSPTAAVDSGNFRIVVFDRPTATKQTRASFGDIYVLETVSTSPGRLVPESVLAVTLDWQSLPILPDAPHKLTLQLLGPEGTVIAQQDSPLAVASAVATGEAVQTSYGILLPASLPAGACRLIAAIYDPSLEGLPRLPVGDSDALLLAEWE